VFEAVFGWYFAMEIVVVVCWTVDAAGATVGMGWIEGAYTVVNFGVGSGLGGGGGDEVLD